MGAVVSEPERKPARVRQAGPAKGPGYGGPAKGSWPPFEPGNDASLRHGAYASPARLSAETEELAAMLAELVPAYRASDGPAVQLLALTWARVRRAEAAIVEAEAAGDTERLIELHRRLRGWVTTAARYLDALGMTPTARARLGLDVALTARAVTVTGLHAAEASSPAGEDVVDGEATEVDDVAEAGAPRGAPDTGQATRDQGGGS